MNLRTLALASAFTVLTSLSAHADPDTLCTTNSRGKYFQKSGQGIQQVRKLTYDSCAIDAVADPVECAQALRCFNLRDLVKNRCEAMSNGRSFVAESPIPNYAESEAIRLCVRDRRSSVYECMSTLHCEITRTDIPVPPPSGAVVQASSRVMYRDRLWEVGFRAKSHRDDFDVYLRSDGVEYTAGQMTMDYTGQPLVISVADGLRVFYVNSNYDQVGMYSYPNDTSRYLAPLGSPGIQELESVYTIGSKIYVRGIGRDGALYETCASGVTKWVKIQ